MLSVHFPEVEYFRRQMPAITVTRRCGCGCGTIEFSIGSEAPRAPSRAWDGPTGPIVEGDAQNWLMLFQADGLLMEREHVTSGDDDWFT